MLLIKTMRSLNIIIILFLLSACAPTTALAPVEPTRIINQYPTMLPTPTLAVVTKAIEGDEMTEALNFFYELKIQMAARDFHHFVNEIRYPITVNVDGQPRAFVFAAELEANIEKIFSEEEIMAFISTDESALAFTADGVKVGDGIIWFDLICLDPACDEAEFMITQINN